MSTTPYPRDGRSAALARKLNDDYDRFMTATEILDSVAEEVADEFADALDRDDRRHAPLPRRLNTVSPTARKQAKRVACLRGNHPRFGLLLSRSAHRSNLTTTATGNTFPAPCPRH